MAKYCPECGNKIKGSPEFCPECGYDLLKEQEADVEASKKTSEKKPEKEAKNKDKTTKEPVKLLERKSRRRWVAGVIVLVLILSTVFAYSYLGGELPSLPTTTTIDSDGDGYNDEVDAFPNDPFEWKDSDNDGIGDNSDAFPNDRNEQYDSDDDGVGNKADEFPYDPTEWKDSDNDGVGDNSDDYPTDPNEQYDSDNDGVGDNADAFPNDSTQSVDRDDDGYGDNPNGFNADIFPDDPDEWKDSDNDDVGDNADILDTGNAGIKVYITKYQGDYYGDEWGETDPYFKIFIYQWNGITKVYDYIDVKQSRVYDDTNIVSYPLFFTVDVDDDVEYIKVIIQGWDDDFWSSHDQIDMDGDSSNKVLYTYFYPQQTSYKEYTADGRLDLLDEMDGYIEYYIEIVEV